MWAHVNPGPDALRSRRERVGLVSCRSLVRATRHGFRGWPGSPIAVGVFGGAKILLAYSGPVRVADDLERPKGP